MEGTEGTRRNKMQKSPHISTCQMHGVTKRKGFLYAGFQDPLKVCIVRTSLLFPLLAKENPGALSEAMTRYSRLCPAACHRIYWAAAHCAHQHVANCSHMPKA